MLERRQLEASIAVKADAGEARTFEGYASVFGTVDTYNDTIAKGAFRQTLRDWKTKGKLPKMLLQHGGGFFGGSVDDLVPIGKWTTMKEDATGLFVEGRLFDPQTDRSAAVYSALQEGELDGLSIGFRTKKSKFDEETQIRTLTEIDLWEVSLVTFPANDPARVTAVRADDLPSEEVMRRWLQSAGFADPQIETILARGYRALSAKTPDWSDVLDALRRSTDTLRAFGGATYHG